MATIRKRVTREGDTRYHVQIRMKGHAPQTASFSLKKEAEAWAAEVETAIRQGRYFQRVDAKRITFSEVIDRYIDHVLAHKSPGTQQVQRSQLEVWRGLFTGLSLADISPARVSAAIDELSKRTTRSGTALTGATVNRYSTCLGHLLSTCQKDWHLIDANPVAKLRKRREPPGRVRFLSEFERERLLSVCEKSTYPHLRKIVVPALSTAMRYSEIMKLRWPDVDLKRGRIVLHQTKNGERRGVAVRGKALQLMKEHAKL